MTDLLAQRDSWSTANCSIARALEVVGNRTTLLLLREASFGTRRFDDFARRVGVSEPVAATRLKQLVADGLLDRRPYREPGQRTRDEYVLTAKGSDLIPVLVALRQWGDTYAADEAGPAVRVAHDECGAAVHARLRCDAGHDVPPSELAVLPGPGLLSA
ncbi:MULTISPECIES: winged helix-turn-helix transcriptional regulator [unclassified Micromonospora]|uniref:winged helix-turn-helix transcriptional regulator n=1 Tax=unclassified Micromonospora TaxID=2617518 RepID=UPI001B358518|nr:MULTISPECIES: helix-turn-helix domain-containing protein [unclassified Micromonospora]MBQ1043033.1 helix-turn-helix transcriptional regulator [Micromonospora sp. C72]MBQ1056681.1 helix-turn-helix transcriptional regulator [Micromonospora sp. C32]